MRIVYVIICLILFTSGISQTVSEKLGTAIKKLEADSQFTHAVLSMYVVDANTGNTVFDKNREAGLAPASVQKIVTSAAALEMLGEDYRYKTELKFNDTLNNHLCISAGGDPTLGSWRWPGTTETIIIAKIVEALKVENVKKINHFFADKTGWETQTIPDGWVWEDIGNYYGAGSSGFNWHENQFNIVLKPGLKIGDSVKILSSGSPAGFKFINELKTAAKGSGDQAYIYYEPHAELNFIRGTIPAAVDSLTIIASAANAFDLFLKKLMPAAKKEGIPVSPISNLTDFDRPDFYGKINKTLFTHYSPPLDSINFWFLKKSINLYGEAFVKTIAFEKAKTGSTDTGISVIREFWNRQGIEKSSLKIIDGSGLSPANRISTKALVSILQYSKKRAWFNSFYDALPEINGIKMKDGYISGVRSYTGYIKNKKGAEYIFAFIVNNFDGNPATAREKMWKVLDLLK